MTMLNIIQVLKLKTELTESVLEMAEDYVEADFEEMKEYYSDSIVSFFNLTKSKV